MSEFNPGDTVVFKQLVQSDGKASDMEYEILIEDKTAYQIHVGNVNNSDHLRNGISVQWEDGESTVTQESKLHAPEDVEWYNE